MKRKSFGVVLAALTLGAGFGVRSASAQNNKPAYRVGVFDSRVVALAYYRSSEFTGMIKGMRDDLARAQAAKDEKRAKELGQEGEWSQIRAHQQVFSTGPVASILGKVKDKLPAIARDAGVALIVSKWEVQFLDPAATTVDVTLPLVKLFNPNDQEAVKWVEEMKRQDPVPFEQLSLDPRM